MPTRYRASTICVYQYKLLTVVMEDPVSKRLYHFPPGGQIELGETAEAAAIRETLEETGYQVVIVPGKPVTVTYDFVWGERVVPCVTQFFRVELESDAMPIQVDDAEYHRGVTWVGLKELGKIFNYHRLLCGKICEMAWE